MSICRFKSDTAGVITERELETLSNSVGKKVELKFETEVSSASLGLVLVQSELKNGIYVIGLEVDYSDQLQNAIMEYVMHTAFRRCNISILHNDNKIDLTSWNRRDR